MHRMTGWLAILLTGGMLAACGEPEGLGTAASGPEPAAEVAAANPESPGEPAADDPAPAAAETGSYDPAADPLAAIQGSGNRLFDAYPAGAPETVAENESLIRHLPANPANLNPIFTSSAYEGYLNELTHDALFSFDAKMEWFVVDYLVESYEESEDRLVSKVKMRPGLKWQDGEPWTAHDVRFSWEAILDDRVPCPAVKPGTDQIADVRVIDDLTFEIVHKEALPTNRWNMLFPIIPRHIYGDAAERERDPSLKESEYYNRHNREGIIGNGPYRVVEWITNDRIVLERWEDYPGPKPHFEKMVFKIQADQNVSLLLFKDGEIDEMILTQQQFATQTNDEEFSRVGVKGLGSEWTYSYIGWNMDGTNPFFADRTVRRAMGHALDIPRLIRTITYSMAEQAHGIYHPDSWTYNPALELIPYDLDRASELLDEAGWLLSDDDGWRYKAIDGRPVKFEFTLLIPQGSTTSPKIAAIYAEDLRSIGVSLLTRTIEWATFQEMTLKHEFQASIAAWGTGTDPDTGWNLWRTEQYADGRNYGGYSNARVDELFELARREFDTDRRAAYYAEIQKLIYDDQPYLFLWNRPINWAFHKRLRGVAFSPRGVFGFDPSVRSWWVARAEMIR